MAIFHGTKHDDDLTGTSGNDTFDLYKGGNDTVSAGDGNDRFNMGAALSTGDRLDGGAGRDVVLLHGDYSAGFVFDDLTIQNIETIRLSAGDSYNLTLAAGNVVNGAVLAIDGTLLGAGDVATIDASALTAGHVRMSGGADNDTLVIGNATAMHGTIFDGGAGSDTLVLTGDNLSYTLGAGAMTSVETLVVSGNFIVVNTNDGNVAAGATLTVDMSQSDFAVFDGHAETDGSYHFISGIQNETMRGGAGADTFDMTAAGGGGTLGAAGNGGNDLFVFADNFGDSAAVNGGAGNDTVELNGGYSGGDVFTSYAMTGIETLKLDDGNSYDLTTNNANVGAGQTLTADASALSAGNTLTFNGAAESDGFFAVTGGAGDDSVNLGHFRAGDTIDGGAGNDTLEMKGDYSSGFDLTSTMMTSVETVKLDNGFSYNLELVDNIAPGGTFTVDASALTASHTLTFNPGGINYQFILIGGAGDDTLTGGFTGSTFTGGMGADQIFGFGGPNDTFVYRSPAESSGAGGYDTIFSGEGKLSLAGVSSIDSVNLIGGDMDSATFDRDLGNICAAAGPLFGPHLALLVDAELGDLGGHIFLVIDVNGDSAYEPGFDYVIDVTHFGPITPDTFV